MRGRRYSRPAQRVSAPRLICSIIIIVVFAAGGAAETTKTGAALANGTQRFLLFYSGVFALVALTMSVAAGIVAADRILMSAGKRIVAQAAHRAIAFVSVAFLVTHILTEIVAAKSRLIDSVVPFAASGHTFYVGLGTVGSDLMVLLVATGIARRRFAEKASPVTWRVLHGTAYLAWPLSIVHGLAAGRHPKPYVSWSYGACLFAVGLALVIRSVVTIRPRHETNPPERAPQGWPGTAASAAAQAYLLHSQQAALAAEVLRGLAAGEPAGTASSYPAHHGLTAPPGGMGAHTPGEWARDQTPAEGITLAPEIPLAPDLASMVYQVQALQPGPPDGGSAR